MAEPTPDNPLIASTWAPAACARILDRTRMMLLVHGPRLEVDWANDLAVSLGHLAQGDSIGDAWDLDDGYLADLLATVESGAVFERSCRARISGELHALVVRVCAVGGTGGELLVVAEDLTSTEFELADLRGKLAGINRSNAVVELSLDGVVLAANDNFLELTGYTASEILGQHHRMFCDDAFAASPAYRELWKTLRAGQFVQGEFRRFGRDHAELWIQATYTPILDPDGVPYKVVKFAVDVTAERLLRAEHEGKVAAIDRGQAVIELALDGTILTANENFLQVMGYRLEEVQGQHHRIFCDPDYARSAEYEAFWEKLGRGEIDGGEYRRIARNGDDVWIRATYNPILDLDGRPTKVVKYALDVTAERVRNAEFEARVEAISRSQAVVEFDLDGNVQSANDNFLRTLGYSLREIKGQHHSMFCDEAYILSDEYRDFWLRLQRGEFISGRFRRVGKYGREVWIQATYNPIFDLQGVPRRVVKFAHDVTAEVQLEHSIQTKAAEMTATVGQLVDSITAIASSTDEASTLASTTQSRAEDGMAAIQSSLEAIDLIQQSSNEIAQIVRVIGEIANQTNLLAFNAAIEAARAGEHGIGFSVVAGEVRKLAERAGSAAQEISQLIDQSANRVSQGAEVSRRARDAFEEIVSSVSRTSDSIGRIAGSAQSQQDTSLQVKELIQQLAAR